MRRTKNINMKKNGSKNRCSGASFVLLVVGLLIGSTGKGQVIADAVLFGEHNAAVATSEEGIYRVFMDMNGDLYPDYPISDTALAKAGNSQLRTWAQAFPEQFVAIAQHYDTSISNYSEANYQNFQQKVLQQVLEDLNQGDEDIQTWVIHGFRKKMYGLDAHHYTRTSLTDNKVVQKVISTQQARHDVKHRTVELYWDGKFKEVERGFSGALELGRIFRDESIPNAVQCGYALRKVFQGLEQDRINILSHSAGTFVASALLFNLDEQEHLPTPNQEEIRLALVASASPGVALFKDFYRRQSSVDFRQKDNYAVMNVVNENDVVLRKGGLARKFGDTSLGCNFKGEATELKAYFESHFSATFFDHVFVTSSGYSHFLSSYVQAPEFGSVWDFLFDVNIERASTR